MLQINSNPLYINWKYSCQFKVDEYIGEIIDNEEIVGQLIFDRTIKTYIIQFSISLFKITIIKKIIKKII